jgi:hypothetical protein
VGNGTSITHVEEDSKDIGDVEDEGGAVCDDAGESGEMAAKDIALEAGGDVGEGRHEAAEAEGRPYVRVLRGDGLCRTTFSLSSIRAGPVCALLSSSGSCFFPGRTRAEQQQRCMAASSSAASSGSGEQQRRRRRVYRTVSRDNGAAVGHVADGRPHVSSPAAHVDGHRVSREALGTGRIMLGRSA